MTALDLQSRLAAAKDNYLTLSESARIAADEASAAIAVCLHLNAARDKALDAWRKLRAELEATEAGPASE